MKCTIVTSLVIVLCYGSSFSCAHESIFVQPQQIHLSIAGKIILMKEEHVPIRWFNFKYILILICWAASYSVDLLFVQVPWATKPPIVQTTCAHTVVHYLIEYHFTISICIIIDQFQVMKLTLIPWQCKLHNHPLHIPALFHIIWFIKIFSRSKDYFGLSAFTLFRTL